MPRKEDQSIRCSFCGKRETQVERLIAGPGVYICRTICEWITEANCVNQKSCPHPWK